MRMTEKRAAGLDIIRTIAVIFVLVTHMFNYTKLLNKPVSLIWDMECFVKYLALTCVPLFVLLSGYLLSQREANSKHYLSIIRILVSYFLIAAAENIIERLLAYSDASIAAQTIHIFDFSYGYSWYVEMYIGLFLLMPFLNLMFRSLPQRKQLLLIGTISFLSFLPAFSESFIIDDICLKVFPDFFENLYVIGLYLVGAYIALYKPKSSKFVCLTIGVTILLFETLYCHFASYEKYAWWVFNNGASLTHSAVALCIFLFFYDMKKVSQIIQFATHEIAACSFEIYLISYITDKICYCCLAFPFWGKWLASAVCAYSAAKLFRLITIPLSKQIEKILKTHHF